MMYAKNNGISLAANYPYTGRDGTCNAANVERAAVTVTGVNYVTPKSQKAIMEALAMGTTSVTLNASSSVFQRYSSGVINSKKCGTRLNHTLNAVGYGFTESRRGKKSGRK